MRKKSKPIKNNGLNRRFSTNVEDDLAEWIEKEASKRFLNEATFIRLALRERKQTEDMVQP